MKKGELCRRKRIKRRVIFVQRRVGAANTHYKSKFFQKAYAHYIRERREY